MSAQPTKIPGQVLMFYTVTRHTRHAGEDSQSNQRQAAGFWVGLQQQQQLPALIHRQKSANTTAAHPACQMWSAAPAFHRPNSPSLTAAGVGRRSSRAGQTPQQSGGNDGDSSDSLDVQSHRGTNGGPAETEHSGVTLLGADDTTLDLHQLTQIQILSAGQQLLQRLTRKAQWSVMCSRHGNRQLH